MIISPDTKIAAILKAHPGAIDAIAGINPHFNKLRNPLLRKILASRVTVREAAAIGKCNVSDFIERLQPLGFQAAPEHHPACEQDLPANKPEPLHYDATLDVRPELESGKDPFITILSALSELQPGGTLLLVNSFEPATLLRILKEKGYTSRVSTAHNSEVHTYITKPENDPDEETAPTPIRDQFDQLYRQHNLQSVSLDVRHLQMPQPMIAILKALETLPTGQALHVRHKRVPVYLLPELRDRGFDYAIREESDEVQLIIIRNPARG